MHNTQPTLENCIMATVIRIEIESEDKIAIAKAMGLKELDGDSFDRWIMKQIDVGFSSLIYKDKS